MCGIIGLSASRHVAADLYEGLIQLQHRGQYAAGMVTFDGCFHIAQGQGYVREAFAETLVRALKGNHGIAHAIYHRRIGCGGGEHATLSHQCTMRDSDRSQRQSDKLSGASGRTAHKDRIHCNSGSDTEALLGVLASS